MSRQIDDAERVILLVEDNPDDMELTRIALMDAGIVAELAWVADGGEAIAFLRREPPFEQAPRPDIVLLDLNLPQTDGRQVLETIKGDPAVADIPIIVLTTSVDDRDVRESYRAHANAFVSKPADFDSFIRALQAVRDFWFTTAVLPPHHDF